MVAMLNGSTARFRHRYIREELGERAYADALEQLTEDERAHLAMAERGSRIPTRIEGKLLDTVVSARFAVDRAGAEAFLRRGGGLQADDMLDGLFSVFARFVSPQQALMRGPAILGAAYTGIRVSVDADERTGGTLAIDGLGDFPYVGVWICGWMEHAIERFGGTAAVAREKAWDAGAKASDRLEFVVRWE